MNCKVCNSTDIIKFNYGGIGLFKCPNCDISYLENFPDNQTLNTLYSKNYSISTKDSDTELRRTVQQSENYSILNIINKFCSKAKHIADIGCDKGFFIDEARRNGFDVYGVELNQNARKYCENIGLKIETDISKYHKKFDVITMNHSLEHFPNPDEYLCNLKSFIENDGLLIIRVPAFDSFSAKILKNNWIWFQPENHYFHYSIKSLKFILEKNGYKILDIHHRNPSKVLHYFKYILSRIEFASHKLIPFKFKILLSQIIKNITATEIIAVAKKR